MIRMMRIIAAGLTAETAKEKVSVTVKGSRFTNYDLAIEGDNVVFRKQGFFIIVR